MFFYKPESASAGRVSAFADLKDASGLLHRAGFRDTVADVDTVTVTYEHPLKLLLDLRQMGETAVLADRHPKALTRALLARTAEIYAERFASRDGRIPATFEIITLTGWTRAVGRNRGPIARAIGDAGRDHEFPGLTHPHHRHAFLPALDEARKGESCGLAPAARRVEFTAIDETAHIVDGHDGVGGGLESGRLGRLDTAVLQSAPSGLPARPRHAEETPPSERHRRSSPRRALGRIKATPARSAAATPKQAAGGGMRPPGVLPMTMSASVASSCAGQRPPRPQCACKPAMAISTAAAIRNGVRATRPVEEKNSSAQSIWPLMGFVRSDSQRQGPVDPYLGESAALGKVVAPVDPLRLAGSAFRRQTPAASSATARTGYRRAFRRGSRGAPETRSPRRRFATKSWIHLYIQTSTQLHAQLIFSHRASRGARTSRKPLQQCSKGYGGGVYDSHAAVGGGTLHCLGHRLDAFGINARLAARGEQRFSPLDQVNKDTVTRLGVAWSADFDTDRGQEATPLQATPRRVT
eukprot:gene31692-42265_t